MEKLRTLLAALEAQPLALTPDRLAVYTENGRVVSHPATENGHYRVDYRATVLINDWVGSPDPLWVVLSAWMATHERHRGPQAMTWEADILDRTRSDIRISLELTEVVRVDPVDQGLEITHLDEPNLEPVLLTGAWADLTITGGPDPDPDAWLHFDEPEGTR